MSEQNRPDFPVICHYNGDLVDAINNSYERFSAKPKHRNWLNAEEGGSTMLPFGIVPHYDDDVGLHKAPPVEGLCPTWKLLAWMMQTALPVVPRMKQSQYSQRLQSSFENTTNCGALVR
mmetsp:Transcript_29652/g.54299  ORF Transcript_29652/g.54299 Transcript_29652/m.54299 type:complete len:119 (-) Transcript_29652:718-1074(-)